MNEALLVQAEQWIALALALGVIAAAWGAVTARSLFVMCMYIAAMGAMAAAALMAQRLPEAALGEALIGAGLAPFVILAALLLSTRALKLHRRARPWLTMAAAVAIGGLVMWAAPVPALMPTRIAMGPDAAPQIALPALLAPLLFVAAVACLGLLGYGERGAYERVEPLERDA